MEKKPYQKPTIARRQMGVSSKFVEPARSNFMDNIDGVPVAQLVADYGSPVFVYSYRKLRSIYESAYRAFSKRYPKVHFAWSYKTNYLQAICKAYHRWGSWAEVVSDWEYDLARRNGMPGEKIIFNGPYKSPEGLRRAATEGAMINIDSFDEIYELEQIAEDLQQEIEVGIRINMQLTTLQTWDRFGLNLESGQAYEAVKRIAASRWLHLGGVHSHIGTFILSGDPYREQVHKLIGFIKQIQDAFDVRIRYLDVGGGFASHNQLKETIYPKAYQNVPSFDQYAEAICPELLNAFPVNDLPTLFLETGRGLVDEAGFLVATVVASKRMTGGARMLVLDAGVNLLFTSFWYDHTILPAEDKSHLNQEPHHVYGPLCMQIDVLCNYYPLPYLERGDRVVIFPVGAYNNTQWMQFIHLRPNVVMIGENGQVSRIRRAETTEDVQGPESVPEWLEESDASLQMLSSASGDTPSVEKKKAPAGSRETG
ncbi:MAG: diaminopimelate decarboxylase [Calditrichaeota bacterium]|nr:MAG: diaminopimelate decarboxylase [Calditrichota bacterium]